MRGARLTHPAGVVVALCLLYVAWTARPSLRKSLQALVAAAVSLSGLAGFALFCWWKR